MTSEQALKEKLVKFAGWHYAYHNDLGEMVYFTPEGLRATTLPPFTRSLDACVKHLFPKLTANCIDPEILYDHDMDYWQITLKSWVSNCSLDSPTTECKEASEIALHFCLAVERLIDRQAARSKVT